MKRTIHIGAFDSDCAITWYDEDQDEYVAVWAVQLARQLRGEGPITSCGSGLSASQAEAALRMEPEVWS